MRVPGVNTFLLIVTVALLIMISWLQWHGRPILLLADKDSLGIEYKDFISIMLTALGVMVAVATFVLGGLAIMGFQALKDEARIVARTVAETTSKTTAETVAARTYREALPVQTTADEAEKIAAAGSQWNDTDNGVGGKL